MSERVLTTLLFTDIADSTARAATLGDRRWAELKAQHDALVGDGFLAAFNIGIRDYQAVPHLSTLAGSITPGYADGPGTVSRFNTPRTVVVDGQGNVYVNDSDNYRVRKITPDGGVSTLAGSGTVGFVDGAGAQAQFGGGSLNLAFDSVSGNLFAMDSGNHRLRKITPAGVVSSAYEFTSPDQDPWRIAVAPSGDIYLGDGTHNRIYKLAGVAGR
jgi:hypothetical protein